VGDASHGTVSLNEVTGEVTFTPDENYNGPASFTYTVTDEHGATDTATVNLPVDPQNDDPVALDDSFNGYEDQSITFSVSDLLGNDTDVEEGSLSIAQINGVNLDNIPDEGMDLGNGTLTYDSEAGSFSFSPDQDWSGTESLTYTVTDGEGGVAQANISLNVDGVADTPNLAVSIVETDDAGTFDVNISAAITDIDNSESLSITIENFPEGAEFNMGEIVDGALVISGDEIEDLENLTMTVEGEATDFNLNVTATATEPNGDQASTSLSASPDFDPEAQDDSLSGTEDQPITFNASDLLGNDTDLDGDTLTISGFDQPDNGTIVDNGDGTFTFTPDDNWNGETDFTYTVSDGNGGSDTATVTIDVSGVNDGPVGVNDTAETTEDNAVTFNPLGNDTDIDNDSLSITQIEGQDISVGGSVDVDNGTVTLNENGTITFTPDGDYSGTQDFEYTVSDGTTTSTATATVEVEAVADAPDITLSIGEGNVVIVEGGEGESGEITQDNFTSTDNGFSVTGRIVDGEGNLSEASTDNVDAHRDGFGVNGTNTGPNEHIGDQDGVSEELIVNFDEDVSSASIEISRLYPNEGGEGANEQGHYEIYRDGVKVGEGDFTAENSNGMLDLNIQAGDGGGFDQIVFTSPGVLSDGNSNVENSDYLINSIEFTTEGEPYGYVDYPIELSAAETDVDGSETLSAITLSDIPEGAVLLVDGQEVTVTDGSAQIPLDSLDNVVLRVSDGTADFDLTASVTSTEPNGDSATSTTSATVESPDINFGPDAVNDELAGIEDQPITFNATDLLSNDTDLDGDTLTISGFDQPDNGTIVDNGDGTFTFTPDDNWNGETDFTYTVSDGNGGSDTATVTIDVR
ncbi:MAG: cadherin-like domain-containing protein, partial [Methylocystaceae bacterium]|nr:cadherin-like domain-containing protein [Methylocystaceae bacterium]